MFSEEQKKKAIQAYRRFGGSTTKAVRHLGYPTTHTLLVWVQELSKPRPANRKRYQHFPAEVKLLALERCYNRGESMRTVAAEIGASGPKTISNWKARLRFEGRQPAVPRKKTPPSPVTGPPPDNLAGALAENERLRLQVAILEETIHVLKKDRGVDPKGLSNREKAVMIDAMRIRTGLSLPTLLSGFGLAKSSFHYARNAARRPDRHAARRIRIREIFEENRSCYGSRRIHAVLRREDDVVSEKIVRWIMRQEKLVVKRKKQRKYNSYQGEVSPAAPDLLKGDFHAERPNEKWVTDITEFSIPAGKLYLSPILDCHGIHAVAWKSSPVPDAELANASLRSALATLSGERPILHSDRGIHYRLPQWIGLLEYHGLKRSMSRKGCSADNAACEGFFGHFKVECFYGRDFRNMKMTAFQKYIDDAMVWYNERRVKVSLGGLTPAEYRASYSTV